MTKKVLVTGASGMLGRSVFKKIKAENIETIGISFSRKSQDLLSLDLTKPADVEACILKYKPDFIIHCAAEKKPDVCQNDPVKTQKLNVQATHHLSELCLKYGAKLIYISTDYVFDGTKPPYQIDDKPNPINAYGLSKRAGELAVLKIDPTAIIVRVPVLFGPVETLEESAVTTIFSTVLGQMNVKNDHWAVRYPTFTPDIANLLFKIISMPESQQLKGIYHFSGEEAFTKYEMAMAMAKLFNLPTRHLKPDTETPTGAPRPHDCHLDNTVLKELIDLKQTNFRSAIKQVLTPFLIKK